MGMDLTQSYTAVFSLLVACTETPFYRASTTAMFQRTTAVAEFEKESPSPCSAAAYGFNGSRKKKMGGEGGQWGSFVDVVLRLGLVGEMELEQKLSDALVPHQSVRVQAVNTQHNFCCSGRCVRFSRCKRL